MVGCLLSGALFAQSQDDDSVSLGDLARYLREHKTPDPSPVPLIDNDNFSQVLSEASDQGSAGILSFSIDSADNSYKVSEPDVSCSLSFSANATALISDPFALRKLPPDELTKLDGPARIEGDDLEIAVHNGSDWTVREITVGLTLIQRPMSEALNDGAAKFLPAVAGDSTTTDDEVKTADTTLIFHLKGDAPPLSTTVFRQALSAPLPPDEDWHWAIVDAKASPPATPPSQNDGSGAQPAAPSNATSPTTGLGTNLNFPGDAPQTSIDLPVSTPAPAEVQATPLNLPAGKPSQTNPQPANPQPASGDHR